MKRKIFKTAALACATLVITTVLAQLQRSSTVIILHVMQLRFEKFRVGTTDFSERGADWRIECDSA